VVTDEQNLSKRERQKLRKQQKREHQQAAAAKARRNRMLATVAIIALVLTGVGALGAGWWGARQDRAQQIAEAQEQLAELGCTEITEMPNLGAGHFSGDMGELAQAPPDLVYPDRPTTSGRHMGAVALTGVYDKVVDERLLVHNLEHGYVNIFYTEDAPDDQVAELTAAAEEWIEGRYQKVIVSRWKADMPGDARFAFTAWDARQLCRDFHTGVALNFLEEWHHLSGHAPERTAAPHTSPDQSGVIDPDGVDGDLLFPPLGEDAPGEDAMDDPEGEEDPDEGAPEEES
jgi:hypothetical protein